ncbi:hypothetical protein VTL71DRAFT_16322 [Oculimacula yallundae]|uniref:Zn(2)-C6 fungal-type domain-containing protein n=1 Tax=Oculimacula yallundae TaxID=86028 RepID=A0ABR4CGC4_9HELO
MMDLDDHVTTTDEALVASKRLNLRRSCESCRMSKGRCISSPDDSQRCLRCVKDGKRCVFLEAKPRPKRAKNSRIRVAEMEEKLESLLALVATNVTNQSINMAMAAASVNNASNNTSPGLSGQRSMSREQPMSNVTNQAGNVSTVATKSLPGSDTSSMLMPDSAITDFTSAYNTPSSNQSEQNFPQHNPVFMYPIFDNLQDVVSKGFITLNQADDGLRNFRSKQCAFPFVVVPSNISIDSLRRERPFLFLAIMCCVAEYNSKLQKHIELELRENLSRRILINGEKSLDLLQGILVYLTWQVYYNLLTLRHGF